MSKKNRRRKQQRARQAPPTTQLRPTGEVPSAQQGAVTPAASSITGAVATPAPRPPAYATAVRGPRQQATQPAAAIDIEARVPYFTSDLRRIAITAGVMLAIIVAVSFVIH